MTGTRKVVITGLLLAVWNAAGLMAFVRDFTMTPEAIARLPANEAGMVMAMPGWEWVVYAVGTAVGLFGALAMAARRARAVPLSLICLVAVVIQFCTQFSSRDGAGHLTLVAIALAGVVTVIAALQFGIARRWRETGLLHA